MQIENSSKIYSDLSCLQYFIEASEWIYMFGRDNLIVEEGNFSIFLSQDSDIIKKIDVTRKENINYPSWMLDKYEHYNLLACF